MEIRVRVHDKGAFEINDKLAGIVPLATNEEQLALKDDIEKSGQKLPITIWKGKVVDGRCRQKALIELGKHILYCELDDELTEDEVACYVKSVNTRRNLTNVQKAMIVASGVINGTIKDISKGSREWGVARTNASNAKWVYENFPDIGQALFDGKSIEIIGANGKKVKSTNIKAIYTYLKGLGDPEEIKESTVEFYNWEAEKAYRQVNFEEQASVRALVVHLLNINERMKEELSKSNETD